MDIVCIIHHDAAAEFFLLLILHRIENIILFHVFRTEIEKSKNRILCYFILRGTIAPDFLGIFFGLYGQDRARKGNLYWFLKFSVTPFRASLKLKSVS